MNDFTQEELKELRECINFTYGDGTPLEDKVQNMIEKYHECTLEKLDFCIGCGVWDE